MSRLSQAARELCRMDQLAAADTWPNRLHPLTKLAVTLIFLIVTMSFPRYGLVGVFVMTVYPSSLFILGELSLGDALRRLRVALPIVCMVGLFHPFFDRQPLYAIGNVAITAGLLSMATLMMKGVLAALASYLLVATTKIEDICYALRLMHIPSVLVTQFLLTLRYLSLLLREAGCMADAYSLRAPGQKGVHFKAWGSLAGQLLLRSFHRANEVYQSMSLRGFNGDFFYSKSSSPNAKDFCYFIVWCGIFAAVRFVWK